MASLLLHLVMLVMRPVAADMRRARPFDSSSTGSAKEMLMKIRRLVPLCLILGFILTAAPAIAADVDGKWTGSVDTPNGAIQVAFNFKADGAKLTGTTTSPDGMEIPIKNGKVDGNKITFDVDIDFGGMAFTLSYVGDVSPDQIKMTIDFMGMPFEFVVKKAK